MAERDTQTDTALRRARAICRAQTLLLAAGVIVFCSAGPARAARLQVTVAGLRNNNGMLEVCVFDTERGFPDCAGMANAARRSRPARAGSMSFELDVPAGPHAVSVLHDENGNGRLDTNIFGIPREGGGVSNNPPPRRGPPRFADALFTLPPAGGAIVVALVYP